MMTWLTNWRGLSLLPRSLAGQLIALILGAIVISQVFTLWLFTDERRAALLELTGGTVVSRTAALVELLNTTPVDLHEQIRQAASSPLLYYWISDDPVIDNSGTNAVDLRIRQRLAAEIGSEREIRTEIGRNISVPRYHRTQRSQRANRPPPRDGAGVKKRDKGKRNVPLVVALSVQLDNSRWLNMAASLNLQRSSLLRLFFSVAIMAIAVIVIIAFTVRRLTRPLQTLALAADQLGRGGNGNSIAEAGPPEVRSAIQAFNTMQERLTRYVQDRTRMLAAVSHDLRTPITSLRIRAEFIEDEENRNRIILTLDEMQRMVEATLSFARDDAKREAPSRVDLGEFLDAIVTDYQDMGQQVSLVQSQPVKAGNRIIVALHPMSMKRALRNLIDNGVRYGNEANVDYWADEKTVTITISDAGPGIPDDDIEGVFEPFIRLETSRNEDTGGIGLGLAIARSNIHAHGGTLTLKNDSEKGLIATVILPREVV